jgi:hypothetical protein
MTVNGLKLPDAFVALIDRPMPLLWWEPKEGINWLPSGESYAVGLVGDEVVDERCWFRCNLELFENLKEIKEETDRLPVTFHLDDYTPEEIERGDALDADLPGFIPFITDFSRIVAFAQTADDEYYCFDCRGNPNEPNIILWDDSCWRRLAPNFDTFINLFEVDERPLLSRFNVWSRPVTPETWQDPIPKEFDGRKSVPLDRPSVTRMLQWSHEQPQDQPLNLLFGRVHGGKLSLIAIDTRNELIALKEHLVDVRRDLEK